MQSPPSPDGEHSAKKRRRGATRLSCAECRRLKLRCDRQVPCSSCVKRGCGAICPDGHLTTGQGNRFVLASTQELHVKISELCTRIRSLEDGLRATHSQLSPDPHPLLSDDLLRLKHPIQRENGSSGSDAPIQPKEEPPVGNIVDAVGSLSVSDSGRTKFFGHSANSWYFLHNEDAEDGDMDDRLPALREILPPQILTITGSFPMSLMAPPYLQIPKDTIDALFWYLPPAARALSLRNIYYEYGAWMYNPLPLEQFNEEIYAPLYDQATAAAQVPGSPGSPGGPDAPLLAHRLALMFMVLAIACQMDPARRAHDVEAEKYHQLARAALFGSRLVDQPTTRAVQALYLMVYYLFLDDPFTSTSNARWALMGMAVKLSQSIGLHRDSGRFRLEQKETQLRRELFWELYTYDSLMSLTVGRPPGISSAHFDIKLPQPTEPVPSDQAYPLWKYRFTLECMSALHDQAFGASTPSYATVMQLDRKLRAHAVPPVLQIAGFGTPEQHSEPPVAETPALLLQRHTVVLIRESNLLYLHRSFFARAITDHPDDPLGSPYGTSVIAAYRSSWSLIALVRNLHAVLKHPTERLWFVWSNLFSCVIILGSIVTRCPSLTLAPSALMQLDSACDLFAKVAPGFRAEKVLGVMMRLREKAHLSLSHFRAGKTPGANPLLLSPMSSEDTEVDELSTLGGRTRLVTRNEGISPPALTPGLSPGLSPTTATRLVPVPLYTGDDAQNVHPNVLEYLRTFAPQPGLGPGGKVDQGMQQQQQQQQVYHSHPSASPSYNGGMPLGLSHVTSSPMASSSSAYPAPALGLTPSGSSYPQYFPVFDYGPTGGEGAYPPLQIDTQQTVQREESPHSTWNAFVAQLGM